MAGVKRRAPHLYAYILEHPLEKIFFKKELVYVHVQITKREIWFGSYLISSFPQRIYFRIWICSIIYENDDAVSGREINTV